MRRGKRERSLRSVMSLPLFLSLVGFWMVLCLFSFSQMNSMLEKKTHEGVMYGLSQRMLLLNKRLTDMTSALQSVTSIAMDEVWSYLHNASYYRRAESLDKIETAARQQAIWRDNICLLIDAENERFIAGSSYLNREDTGRLLAMMKPAYTGRGYTLYHPIRWERGDRLMMSFSFAAGPLDKRQTITCVVITGESVDDLLNQVLPDAGENDLLLGRVYLTDSQGAPLDDRQAAEGSNVRILSQPNGYGVRLCYEIPQGSYHAERNQALAKMTLIFLAGLTAAVLIASRIVRRIRRPMRLITDTIGGLQLGRPLEEPLMTRTGIAEFDLILRHTAEADRRIRQAMETVLTLEKEKHAKDVMMLRMQINPHFLYNALNAVQWMARLEDTRGVEAYMRSLLYILHYNLDEHGGHLEPLAREIDLMRAYVRIHQARYENEIELEITGDIRVGGMAPRFILQPLVENAIYHGLRNGDGRIELAVDRAGEQTLLFVRDNGTGIAPEVLRAIDQGERRGMGIGIRYVKAIVEESGGSLTIRNRMRDGAVCGTEAFIRLPYVPCGEGDDEAPAERRSQGMEE